MKGTATILSLLLLLCSCDCVQDIYGIVLDAETLQPINSVYVYKHSNEDDFGYTDAQGHFEINSISGGLSFGCPPMTVMFKKNGYEVDSAEIEVGAHAKVYLNKTGD
ncbi:hypothetical protein I2I11_04705 [Pontibacter sp. 172403-2]|uniref:hypothetical protein n=1 Tax=Pontibacter rufus TaxID=2791028 RepID=UPI0018AFAEC4|nr:hypothetical protein [Pontibacter sp. 172403-2]MBF9252585.1 hypothetical protein [Pontibacter sp. 172403-2]